MDSTSRRDKSHEDKSRSSFTPQVRAAVRRIINEVDRQMVVHLFFPLLRWGMGKIIVCLKGALSKVCRSSLPLCLQHPPSKQFILITLSFVWFQVLYKLLRNCLVRRSCSHMSWKVVAREREMSQ